MTNKEKKKLKELEESVLNLKQYAISLKNNIDDCSKVDEVIRKYKLKTSNSKSMLKKMIIVYCRYPNLFVLESKLVNGTTLYCTKSRSTAYFQLKSRCSDYNITCTRKVL